MPENNDIASIIILAGLGYLLLKDVNWGNLAQKTAVAGTKATLKIAPRGLPYAGTIPMALYGLYRGFQKGVYRTTGEGWYSENGFE